MGGAGRREVFRPERALAVGIAHVVEPLAVGRLHRERIFGVGGSPSLRKMAALAGYRRRSAAVLAIISVVHQSTSRPSPAMIAAGSTRSFHFILAWRRCASSMP